MSLDKTCPKICCEICGEKNKDILHRHHITEQIDTNCTNHPFNLAVVCPTCHSKIHNENIKIVGVFPSTKQAGRILIYIKDGVCNVPGMENAEPYYVAKTISMKVRSNE